MKSKQLPNFLQAILVMRRKARIKQALSKIAVKDDLSVLDIGCGIDGRSFQDFIPKSWSVTGVDQHDDAEIFQTHPNFKYVQGDAADLSEFKDLEFDLAISIGMLEHITEMEMFEKVVKNIRRVARQHIVIVPWKFALIEPHYGVPFFPIFPYRLKLFIIKLLNLSNHRQAVLDDPEYVNKHFMWLSNSEYKRYFPDSKICVAPTLDTIAIIKSDNNKPSIQT